MSNQPQLGADIAQVNLQVLTHALENATPEQINHINVATDTAYDNYVKVHAERQNTGKQGKGSKEITREEIAISLARSLLGYAGRNNKLSRQARKAEVARKANDLGIRFAIYREIETTTMVLNSTIHEIFGNARNLTLDIQEEDTITPHGGHVVAYAHYEGSEGLVVEFSLAICRKDEAFDPLIGKEVALDKFLAEETVIQLYNPRPPQLKQVLAAF